jgi:hypothetical protein
MTCAWPEWLRCPSEWETYAGGPTKPSSTPAEPSKETVDPSWRAWRYSSLHKYSCGLMQNEFRILIILYYVSNFQKQPNCMKKASTMTKLHLFTSAVRTGKGQLQFVSKRVWKWMCLGAPLLSPCHSSYLPVCSSGGPIFPLCFYYSEEFRLIAVTQRTAPSASLVWENR